MKNVLRLLYHKLKSPKSKIALNSSVSLNTNLGIETRILSNCRVGDCSIGRYSYIGYGCTFERTIIGSFCSIGPQVICGMSSHPLDFVSTYPGFYTKHSSGSKWLGAFHKTDDFKKVEIGSDVWIGARVIIIGGTKIGHGAVVAAGSVVTKDVPPYAIVAGVPARIIRYRFDSELIDLLLKTQWWNYPIKALESVSYVADSPRQFINQLSEFSISGFNTNFDEES